MRGETPPALSLRAWAQIAAVSAAFVLYYRHFFVNHLRHSLDPDWSFAYLVPVISVYYIYEHRRRILSIPTQVCWAGVPLLLAGMAMYFFFTLRSTANHTAQGAAMMLSLLGTVLTLVGFPMWRALLFPQLFLALGIKLPPTVMLTFTPTLQRWAATGSYYLLNAIGYETEQQGTVLSVFYQGEHIPLNVAEACSGMRMIVAFLALGVAIAFFSCPRWWQRAILIASAVPVAVVINIFRVATIGILATRDIQWAGGDAHLFLGMVWLIPALVLYLGIAWILQNILVEVDEDKKSPSVRSGS